MSKIHFTLHSAVHLFLIRGGEILLSRRFNTGWGDGMYSVVAGHLDGGESVTEAMIREAKEEGDIDIKREDLKVVHTMHRNSGDRECIDFFLETHTWTGEPKIMEPDKCDDLAWFPLGALPENTIPYIRETIERYPKGKTFSELGW